MDFLNVILKFCRVEVYTHSSLFPDIAATSPTHGLGVKPKS
jgi:hypothetical protein